MSGDVIMTQEPLDEAVRRADRVARFAAMDQRDIEREHCNAVRAPRVPWLGGAMRVMMPSGETAAALREVAATHGGSAADADAVMGERPRQARGTYITVNEIFHGQGAVGAMSLACAAGSPDLAWAGGVDNWAAASELAEMRHAFGPRAVRGDAREVFADPALLDYVDLVVTGSPCQKASWAPWIASGGTCAPPDGDHEMNQLYWQQVAPLKQRGRAMIIEFPTGVLKVTSATNETPGWLHHKMLDELGAGGWSTHCWQLQAAMHGSYVARRRLYTFGFAPDVVAAAERAGLVFPERPEPLPEHARGALGDALVDKHIIDEHHADLYMGVVVELRELKGDGTDVREACRMWTGRREPEPVSDTRLPGLPLKCYGEFPLIAVPGADGAGHVRRMLPAEFIRAGLLSWSVGWALSAQPTEEEIVNLKTLGGNTWDGALTRIAAGAAAAYMQPWLEENKNEPASASRIAARFACLLNRSYLPARRALRRWRKVTEAQARAGEAKLRRFAALVHEVVWRLRLARVDAAFDSMSIEVGGADDTASAQQGCSGGDDVSMGRQTPHDEKLELPVPGEAAGVSRSSSMFLTRGLEAAICGTGFGWTRCVQVDDARVPVVRRTHTGRSWGARLATEEEVRQGQLHNRALPDLRAPPASAMPPPPPEPTEAEQAELRAACPTRAALYKEIGARKQHEYDSAMELDAKQLAAHGAWSEKENPKGWRVKMKGGVHEYRIANGEFNDDAVRIAHGRAITFDEDDRPLLERPVPLVERMKSAGGSVVIQFGLLLAWMVANAWPDREMRWMARWGHWDKSDARPSVASLSPNQKAAYDNYEGTCAAHQLEVDKGWTVAWSKAPYAVTMHVCQTNVVPKSNGTMRLLGNPSHPEPGTVGWLIEGLPVAPNRATDWNQMPGYEWASIEEFAAAMAIIVAIAVMARGWADYEQLADILALLVVCGSRDDLTKWFRQIPLCTLDMHKQVYHWAGRYLVDQHVQMGRVSSADGAQRLSMVAKAILFQRVEARLRELLAAAATALWQFLARIVEYRRVQLGSVHTDLWCIDLMQDDLAWVAITVEVGTIVREMTVSVLAEYGIEVSVEKRAEDEATIGGVQPNAVVLFIGARFDATDLRHVTVRGQDKTVERLAPVMDEWTPVRAGGRVRRVLLCRTIGMLMFQGRFGRRFRRRLNSGIRLLRGGGETFAHVSAEWLRDVASMWAEVQLAQGVPLTLDPVWWHPGLLGCNSDASRPDARPGSKVERGFGGNALEFYFFGEWSVEETTLLDISTLELIAAGFLLIVAHLSGVTRPQMVMRCDNESACRVCNDHVAHSVAMAEALMWLESVQCFVGVELRLHHIAGVDNVIADDLSRDHVARAVVALQSMSGRAPVEVEIPAEWRDLSAVVDAVKRRR